MDYNNIKKALEEKYSTNLTSIYIPSLKRTVDFRSIKVGEQKTITKIMLDSNGDQGKIYQAMLGLIKATAVDEDFDIRTISELDRIKILVELYKGNYFKNDITIKCPKCKTVNTVSLNFDDIVSKLNDINVEPIVEEIGGIEFTLTYPNVVRFGSYYKTVKSNNIEDLYDIYDHFIARFKFDEYDVDLNNMSIKEIENLLCIIPEDILYGEGGVVSVITDKLFKIFDSLTEAYKCEECGETLSGGLTIQDFFT